MGDGTADRGGRVAGARLATWRWGAVIALALSIFQLGSRAHSASPPSGISDVGGAPSQCTPVPPTATANPQAGGPMSPQTTAVFEITVVNNDRGPCDARLLLLAIDSLPPHVVTFVQPALVGVLPGATARFLLAVTADTSAAPGVHAIPYRIRDLGLNDQLSGVVTYDLRPGSSCLVRPDRELFVRDLSVVEDPIRTMGRGAWTFGHLARHLAVTEGQAPAVTEQLFRTWLSTQMVNDFPVAARPGMKPFLLDRWPRLSDGSLDLDRAPLRLLAIVNRIDLRSIRRERAGEVRFVFNVLGPGGGPSLFNLILEYAIPARNVAQVLEWAHRWHALAALPFPGEEYNTALERITERIITARDHGGGLASLRTNDFSLAHIWELRQFGLGPDGLLREEPVALTPDTGFLGGGLLADFVNGREDALLRGNQVVPLRFRGVPFRGGSSINMLQAWNAPGLRNLEARHVFSVNTCNGCHSSPETGTNFLHVEPRASGTVSALSGFLQGMAVIDPFSGQVRVLNDVGRRKADMEKLVCDDDVASACEEIFRVH